MCNPAFVLAISVAQSAVKFQQAQGAARTQTRNFNLNAKFGEEIREQQMGALNSRLLQENMGTGERIEAILRQAGEAEGFNMAAAAAGGVGGEALFAVLQDVERAAAKGIRTEEINLENLTEQIARQKEGVVQGQFASLLSVPRGAKPSVLVPLLEIAGAFGTAYAAGAFTAVEGGTEVLTAAEAAQAAATASAATAAAAGQVVGPPVAPGFFGGIQQTVQQFASPGDPSFFGPIDFTRFGVSPGLAGPGTVNPGFLGLGQ